MPNKIPRALQVWFVIHFVVDILFGIPLLLFPQWTLQLVGIAESQFLTARLVGAALIGIGTVSLVMRNSSKESYNALLTLKIIWAITAIIGLLLSYFIDKITIALLFFIVFLVFLVIWIYYKRNLK